jgi:hypothetical protein
MKKTFMKKIFCRHRRASGEFCNLVVATSDGKHLFFDGEPVKNNPRFIGFECPGCGHLIRWRRLFKDEQSERQNSRES